MLAGSPPWDRHLEKKEVWTHASFTTFFHAKNLTHERTVILHLCKIPMTWLPLFVDNITHLEQTRKSIEKNEYEKTQ